MVIGARTPLAAALATGREEANRAKGADGASEACHAPGRGGLRLQALRSLQCLSIQGQAVPHTGNLLEPDVENAFNLRDNEAGAHAVFAELSLHVPFVLLGKHAAYRVPLWQRDFARLDAAYPVAQLPRVLRTMLLHFFAKNPSRFAAVYPAAASLLREHAGRANESPQGREEGPSEGPGRFGMVYPCCYP